MVGFLFSRPRLLSIIFPVCLALSPPLSDALAGEMVFKVKSIQSKSELTWLQIGEDENHGIGTYERIGVWLLEDGQVATITNKGNYEWTKDRGKHNGYVIVTFPDGSTLTDRYQGTDRQVGDKVTWEGTGRYVAGTGRFKGVKGEDTYKGGAFGNGMAVTDIEVKLVLPD